MNAISRTGSSEHARWLSSAPAEAPESPEVPVKRRVSRGRLIGLALVVLALVTLVVFAAVALRGRPSGNPIASSAGVPNLAHIWVIFMENRDYSQLIGSPDAPYINQLATQYALATRYYGVMHGSQPNYIAFFSGETYGVTGGSTPNLAATNLVDQLETAGRSWRVFAENYPGDCYNGITATGGPDGPGTWVRRHTPALAFKDIRKSAARCANIQPLRDFEPGVADFELIVPNLTNSMHDGTTRQGDAFLKSFVPRITGSAAWKDGGALFIVWDEGKETGPNHITALVISPLVARGTRSSVRYDHYSLLATIENAWHLGCLGKSCGATPMTAFFERRASAAPS
jgi:phosphatidylinositol-3-phosphatase